MAQIAEVEGHVTGKVEVSDVLILKPTAVIDGDIITNKMVVESGAVFNGSCKMSNSNGSIGGQSKSGGLFSKSKKEEAVKTA